VKEMADEVGFIYTKFFTAFLNYNFDDCSINLFQMPEVVDIDEMIASLPHDEGKLMANEDGALLSEGRKQVYKMYFKKLDDINENQVRALLFEAAMIDDQFATKKR